MPSSSLWKNHHTCINDYLDFWVNTTVMQGNTYKNRTNNDQCFISKVKLYVMRDPPWAALLTLWISLGITNNNGLYFRNDNIPKQVRQDYGHVSRWYRVQTYRYNDNGSTVFFHDIFFLGMENEDKEQPQQSSPWPGESVPMRSTLLLHFYRQYILACMVF